MSVKTIKLLAITAKANVEQGLKGMDAHYRNQIDFLDLKYQELQQHQRSVIIGELVYLLDGISCEVARTAGRSNIHNLLRNPASCNSQRWPAFTEYMASYGWEKAEVHQICNALRRLRYPIVSKLYDRLLSTLKGIDASKQHPFTTSPAKAAQLIVDGKASLGPSTQPAPGTQVSPTPGSTALATPTPAQPASGTSRAQVRSSSHTSHVLGSSGRTWATIAAGGKTTTTPTSSQRTAGITTTATPPHAQPTSSTTTTATPPRAQSAAGHTTIPPDA
jgi:hypothetical protein